MYKMVYHNHKSFYLMLGQQPVVLTHLHLPGKGSRMTANEEQGNYFATKTLIIIAYASEQMPQLIMIRII